MVAEFKVERLGAALLLLAVGFLLGFCAGRASGQTPERPHVIPVLIVAPAIRDSLDRAWNDMDPRQSERAGCLAWHALLFQEGPVKIVAIRIDSLVKVDTVTMSNGYAITFRCREKTVPFHVHTPVTCEGGPPVRGASTPVCAIGGLDAYECFASPADVVNLEVNDLPFGVIQCDRHAIIAFFPRPPENR